MKISESATVIAENMWLWRADHDSGPPNPNCTPTGVGGVQANQSSYGLVVDKDASLTCIGLASEHHLIENTLWSGSGKIFFYQSELVYCPPTNFSSPGLTIESTATLLGRAMGVYSYFPVSDCVVPYGIVDSLFF